MVQLVAKYIYGVIIKHYIYIYVLYFSFGFDRERRQGDLFYGEELRIILCGSWRSRPIWDYNPGKNSSWTCTQEGK